MLMCVSCSQNGGRQKANRNDQQVMDKRLSDHTRHAMEISITSVYDSAKLVQFIIYATGSCSLSGAYSRNRGISSTRLHGRVR